MMENRTNRALAARLKQRDPQAMEELYDGCGRFAYGVILRLVRDPSVAEDLTQEAFIKVWNRIARFDEERGELSSWVLAVARNCAIDHLRSMQARMDRNACGLDHVEESGCAADFERRIVNLDRLSAMSAAFENLTANQRLVLNLSCQEGMSQAEIAKSMRRPLGTVKTWMRTALKSVRASMPEALAAQ